MLRRFSTAALFAALLAAAAPARAEAPCDAERAAWTKEQKLETASPLAACELTAEHFADAARIAAPFVHATTGDTKERERIAKTFTAARARVLTVKVEIDILDAEVLIDGAPAGRSPLPMIFLAPGNHTVVARAPGRESMQQVVAGEAGETATATIRLVPRHVDVVGYDLPTTEPAPPTNNRNRTIIIAGGAAAGVAFGVGVTLVALSFGKGSAADDARKKIIADGGSTATCAAPSAAFVADCASLHDSLSKRDSLANAAVGSFLVAGGLLGATLLYAYWPSSKKRDNWEPSIARVRPAPLVGRGVGGLVVTGSF